MKAFLSDISYQRVLSFNDDEKYVGFQVLFDFLGHFIPIKLQVFLEHQRSIYSYFSLSGLITDGFEQPLEEQQILSIVSYQKLCGLFHLLWILRICYA